MDNSISNLIREAKAGIPGAYTQLAQACKRAGQSFPRLNIPLSKEICSTAEFREEFYHATLRNADGTAKRCRVNGKIKTWKRQPDKFRLPVKHGMYDTFYIDQFNCHEWLTDDPTEV